MSEEGCWGRDVGFADPFRSCRCSLPLVPRVALSLPPAPLLRRSCTDFSSGYSLMQDRKLRKILSGEQYPRWRTRHPRKFIPMPEPVFRYR